MNPSKKRRLDRINQRCQKLIELGFVINHEDSSVTHPAFDNFEFDFSAVDERHFLRHALTEAYNQGMKSGRKSIQDGFRALMVM